MSLLAIRWAWGVCGLRAAEKLVLLCLADHANHNQAWPSRARIAGRTGLDIKTIDKSLKTLRDRGLIVAVGGAGRACQVRKWQLDLDYHTTCTNNGTGTTPKNGGGDHPQKRHTEPERLEPSIITTTADGGGGLDPEILKAIDDEVRAQVDAGVARHPERLHNHLKNKAISGGTIYETSWRRALYQRREREQASARASDELARRRAASIATVAVQTAALPNRNDDLDRIFGSLRAAMRGGEGSAIAGRE